MKVYNQGYFSAFNPEEEFEKWAAKEVADYNDVPDDMETFTLQGGLYAVFDYKGSSSDPSIFSYIFGTWIPDAEFVLDDRPHFEVLGEKYRNEDPESEEQIYIPVRPKNSGERPLKY